MSLPNLVEDENQFISEFMGQPSARLLSLNDCLERKLLISPDSGDSLYCADIKGKQILTTGQDNYEISSGSPILYPNEITSSWINGGLPFACYESALKQYVLLSQIKQSGEINAPLNSEPARKHQWRYKEFCKSLSGLILDVGSDKPSHSIQFLSEECDYLGLDPYAGSGEFRIVGLGEILPLANESVDVVTFNTSLDHILDYHSAIDEAFRVLRLGGKIVIATYAWLERATLLKDSVHFHHFREWEILGALGNGFDVIDIMRYQDPKYATHRYGLYVMGVKL